MTYFEREDAYVDVDPMTGEGAPVTGYDQRILWGATADIPAVELEEVLALQELIQHYVDHREASVLQKQNKAMMVAINNLQSAVAGDNAYDGTTDDYLRAIVKEVEPDQWQMTVRFSQTPNIHEERQVSYIDEYRFDWLESGAVQAWNAVGRRSDDGKSGREYWSVTSPLDTETVVGVRNRIIDLMRKRAIAQSLKGLRGTVFYNLK